MTRRQRTANLVAICLMLLAAIVAGLIVIQPVRALTPNTGEHIHVSIANHPVDGFVIPRARTTYQITVTAHKTTGPVTWFRLCNGSSGCFDRLFFDGQNGRPSKLGPCTDCSVTFPFTADFTRWSAGRWELRWTANIQSNRDGERQFSTSRSQVCIGSCTNRDDRQTPFNGGGSWYLDRYATVYDLSPDTAHRPGGSVIVRAAQDATRVCAFHKPDFHNLSSGTRLGCWSDRSNHTVRIPSTAVPGDRLVLFADQANGNAGLFVSQLGNGSARATTTYEYQSWWAKGGVVLP